MGQPSKRLLVFGDSYGAESLKYTDSLGDWQKSRGARFYFEEQYNNSPSWIDQLSDLTGTDVRHVGVAGTGPSDVVWQLTNFLANDCLTEDDIVIICWSQYNRSKDKTNEPIRFPDEYHPSQDRMSNAVKLYFHFIYNDDERLNVYNASVLAVDQLLKDFAGKLFHFYCFGTEFHRFPDKTDSSTVLKTYQPTTGNLCTQFHLSELCEKHYKTSEDDSRFWSLYPNHMGPLANADLINYIQERL